MGIKIMILTVLSIYLVPFVNLMPVHACSPAPWTFDEAFSSKAMIYGKVIKIKNDNREATVEVISYVGPDEAPRVVHLPSTEDSREVNQGSPCPDFSMKFEKGSEYVFFLSDIPPNLQLLEPQWKTATFVENGRLTVGMPRGEKDSLQNRLQEFAESKGYEIQTPNKNSPVWGTEINWIWFIPIFLTICFLMYFIYSYRKRTKNS